MDEPRVVAVSGSPREDSHTQQASRLALDAAAAAGARADLLDLRTLGLPAFDPDVSEPESVRRLTRTVVDADGLILGTPVYHGSYSSTLKTALDWCGREEFRDTTVGLLATSGGGGYDAALSHLRVVVRTIHGWTVPRQVGIRSAADRFDGDTLTDDALRDRLRALGREVAVNAGVNPRNRTARPAD